MHRLISQSQDRYPIGQRSFLEPSIRCSKDHVVNTGKNVGRRKLESVTRSLSETTQIIRRITGKAAPYAEAAPLVAAVTR